MLRTGGNRAAVFLNYYSSLYQTEVNKCAVSLERYLDQISFPVILAAQKEFVDSPITLAELKLTLKGFGENKSPSLDGFSFELYGRHEAILLSALLRVILQSTVTQN